MIGYDPAAQAIRAELGLPYATGADEPPDWHNHPGAQTCWADPLSRAERRDLASRLARACQRFYNTPAGTSGAMLSQIVASAEMSDLHLDVTERAEVAA